jgi:hypothetical protein
LPSAGDTVAVEGAVIHVTTYPIIIVFTINGEIWRDDGGFGPAAFGKWMNGGQNKHLKIVSPFDTLNQIHFQNGWHHGGIPGSMYCQMLEIHHRNVYRHQEHHAFAAYELAFMNTQHQNLMHGQQGQHEMKFNKQVRIQFHYSHRQMEQAGLNQDMSIHLYSPGTEAGSWVEEKNIFIDAENQLITLLANTLKPFYLLAAEELTASVSGKNDLALRIKISPNPATDFAAVQIAGTVTDRINVSLYNISGRLVTAEMASPEQGNSNTLYFNTSEVPDGMYWLRITSGKKTGTVPMIVFRN